MSIRKGDSTSGTGGSSLSSSLASSSYASPRKAVPFLRRTHSAATAQSAAVAEFRQRYIAPLVTDLFPVAVPKNVATLIFSHLAPNDLLQASLVSKRWREYADNAALWATFAQTLGLKVHSAQPRKTVPAAEQGPLQRAAPKNWSRVAIQAFRATAARLSRAELVEACYKRMLWQRLADKEGCGYSGWLSVRGEHLLKKWKRRWAVVWNNCLVLYASRRPDEYALALLPLTADVRVDVVRRALFTLSSRTGVLLSYKLDAGGSVVECQQGAIFLDAGHAVEALAWMTTVRANALLSQHLVAHDGRAPSQHALLPQQHALLPQQSSQQSQSPQQASQQQVPQVSPPHTPLFGVALAGGAAGGMPAFLGDIMDRLEATALDEEGLFRLSGAVADVLALRARLEASAGGRVDLTHEDPHTLTAVLKLFFRELPAPLVPPDVNQVINAFLVDIDLDAASAATVTGAVEAVRFALAQLPPAHLAVLHRLARLLRAVAAHADTNLMTRDNLFIVLLPTLRCAPSLLSLAMLRPDELFATSSISS